VPIESLGLVAALSSAIAHLAAKKGVGAAVPAAFLAVRWGTASVVMTVLVLLGPGWGGYQPSWALAALATGAVLGPVVGWLLYLRALPRLDVSVAQPIFNSSSVVTMALAVLFLGEQPTPFILVGAALILAGVHLLQSVEAERHAPRPRRARLWQPAILLVLGGACCLGIAGFFFRLGLGVLSPVETNWVRTTMPALVLLGGNLLVEAQLAARARRAGSCPPGPPMLGGEGPEDRGTPSPRPSPSGRGGGTSGESAGGARPSALPGLGGEAGVAEPEAPKRVFLSWLGLGLGMLVALANDVVGWLLRLTAMKGGLLIVVEPLAATSPLFVALLSAPLLGERLGRRGWAGVGLTVLGAALLTAWGR
jgi:transporter family protein